MPEKIKRVRRKRRSHSLPGVESYPSLRLHFPPLRVALYATGAAIALLLIILWRQHWLLWATVILMLAGIPVVALTAASYLAAAFNPLTLNVSLAALASIAIVAGRELPMATRCRRTPKDPL